MSGNLLHTAKSWSQKRMTEVSPDEYIRHPSLAAGGSPEQFREDPLCLPSKPLLLSPQRRRPHCSPWTAGEPFGEVLGHWPLPFFFWRNHYWLFWEIFLCTVITCASLRMQKFWHCLQHSWEAKATSRKFHLERFWAGGSGLGGGPKLCKKVHSWQNFHWCLIQIWHFYSKVFPLKLLNVFLGFAPQSAFLHNLWSDLDMKQNLVLIII